MSVVWVFLDGVGIGGDDPAINPWAGVEEPTLIAVEGHAPGWPGAYPKPLDASLGVPGLPQSATGTTALFTGINAPAALGYHLTGFPVPKLIEIIAGHSVHKQARTLGITSTFANAFHDGYFKRPATRRSVSTHSVEAAGIPFRTMEDYRAGKAVFHDLSGELVPNQGARTGADVSPPVDKKQAVFKNRFLRDPETFAAWMAKQGLEVIGPEESGRRVGSLAREYDLVVFEYAKSDMMGHTRDPGWGKDVVAEVMAFLRALLATLDPAQDTLLIASDHGNSEDLSVRTHTLNPVAAVAVGPDAEAILADSEAITDLTPAVLRVLGRP